jgi:hypothetical protein
MQALHVGRRRPSRRGAFLPKPRLLIDDAQVPGWGVVELHPAECSGLSAAEVLARIAPTL